MSAPPRGGFTWALALPPLAGALTCAWLVADFIAVYGGGVASGLFCGASVGAGSHGASGCEAVAAHPAALLLGFPLAGWGLSFQLILLGCAVGAAALRSPERATCLAAGAWLAGLGSLFALWLVRVMWTEVGATCGGCLLAHAWTVTSFVAFAWARRGAGGRVHWRSLWPVLGSHAEDESAYFKGLLLALGWGVLLAALGLTWWRIHVPLSELRRWGTEQVAAFHERRLAGEPGLDLERFAAQPWTGAAQAPVSVVVVGDFECSQCRSLARALRDLDAEWPGALRTSFVNAPLSSRCNPAIATDLHPEACWLAAAGECASEQGRFDAYHALLFGELPAALATRAEVEPRLGALGLDLPAFGACMAAGRGFEAVARDLELCRELGLTTTPSIVINGFAKLGSVHPWMLRKLLEPLVEEARR